MFVVNFEHILRLHHIKKLRNPREYNPLYAYCVRKKVYARKVKDRIMRHNRQEKHTVQDMFLKVYIALETFWYIGKYK